MYKPIKSGQFQDPIITDPTRTRARTTARIVRWDDKVCYVQFGADGLPVDQGSEIGKEIMMFLENGGEITDAPQE